MKVYVNRSPRFGPYGGGNMWVTAFHKRAPSRCELLTDPNKSVPEIILLAGLDNDGQNIGAEQAILYKMYCNPDVKIVLRVNECDARKGTDHVDPVLLQLSEHIDGAVFVSKWLQEYFETKGWACKNNIVIHNGVAADVFKPQPKLNNGKVNILSSHWSDNPMKGQFIHEKLDELIGQQPDRFAYTFVGRSKYRFKHAKHVQPLYGKELGEELGKHDVSVSASLWEPGPNHVLETLSCGLPTYVYKDGGGCVEFAGQDHVYQDWPDLVDRLSGPLQTNRQFTLSGWGDCIQKYIDFLEATRGSR